MAGTSSVYGPILVFIVAYCLYALLKPLFSPLRRIPGPHLARFSRIWLFKEAYYGTFPFSNIKLHQKYGRIVRIAPNEYSIDDPMAAKLIYGSGRGYIKSPWYEASGNPANPLPGLFDERDQEVHANARRKVAAAYSMTSLVSLETFVEECTEILFARLEEFAKLGLSIDVSHWMQCYAFDVINKITTGSRFGFLERGEDVQGMMASISQYLLYSVRVGIFSEWHSLLFRYTLRFKKLSGLAHVRQFARSRLATRCAERIAEKPTSDPFAPTDFITKLLNIQEQNPSKISKEEILVACSTNIGAGSDTTSISLSAVIFYLLKYRQTLLRLRAEIHDWEERGLISDPVKFSEAQQMIYLQAVIKEALRLHPATGLILGRVVPEGGAILAGQYFPGGTVVGINSWVAHSNQDVFGPDVHIFRPERWLEEPELVKKREAYFMTFGMGSRTCIGKNISLLEISKVVPQLVRHFDFIPDTESGMPEWRTENVWFVKTRDFRCKVSMRYT